MKHISLFKILTTVVVVLFSGSAFGQAQAPAAGFPVLSNLTAAEQELQRQGMACEAASSKVATARSAYFAACRKDKIGDCSTLADKCEEFLDDEMPIGFGMDMFATNETAKTCGELSKDELNTQRREAKEDKRTYEREAKELAKQKVKEAEEFQKDSGRIKEEMADLTEEGQKAETQAKEDERNLEAQARQTEQELKRAYQDLENQVRKLQNEKLQATIQRKLQVAGYGTQMDQCRMAAEELYEKMYSARVARQRVQSSINSLIKNGGTPKDAAIRSYKSCMENVIVARNAGAEVFKSQIETIDMQIGQLEEQKADIKKNQEAIVSQAAQAKADAKDALSKAKIANYNRQLQKYQALQALDASYQEQQQNMLVQMQQAKMSLNEASNSLVALKASTPITTYAEKMSDSYYEWESSMPACERFCGEKAVSLCGAKPGSSNVDGTKRNTTPRRGADGR